MFVSCIHPTPQSIETATTTVLTYYTTVVLGCSCIRVLSTIHCTLSYAKALKNAQRESVETTIYKRRLFFAEAVMQQLATMSSGENPGQSGKRKSWHRCLIDYSKCFRSTQGSAEILLCGCLELRRCDAYHCMADTGKKDG